MVAEAGNRHWLVGVLICGPCRWCGGGFRWVFFFFFFFFFFGWGAIWWFLWVFFCYGCGPAMVSMVVVWVVIVVYCNGYIILLC